MNVPENGFFILIPNSFTVMLITALIDENMRLTEEVDNPFLNKKSLYFAASIDFKELISTSPKHSIV